MDAAAAAAAAADGPRAALCDKHTRLFSIGMTPSEFRPREKVLLMDHRGHSGSYDLAARYAQSENGCRTLL